MSIWRRVVERPYLWVVTLAVVLRLPTFTTRLFDADEAAIGVQGMVVRDGYSDRHPSLPCSVARCAAPILYVGAQASEDVVPVDREHREHPEPRGGHGQGRGAGDAEPLRALHPGSSPSQALLAQWLV